VSSCASHFIALCFWGSVCIASERPASLYEGLAITELEQLEYDRPDDASLKLELGRQYWCRTEKGLAFEHWRWLVTQDEAPLANVAEKLLKSATKDPRSLNLELCKAYPQSSL